jgi:SAM-dependent methyltransferase
MLLVAFFHTLLSLAMATRTVHPFPARMAPEIALNYIPEAKQGEGQRILDPMCGSGTVLSVASKRGHKAVGVDLDPLAILMSRVATTSISGFKCDQLCEQIVEHAMDDNRTDFPWDDDETNRFAEFWFAEQQRKDLARLSRAIQQVSIGPLRRLAQISLSRTIITKAPKASLAADTSHSRPHRVRDTSDYNVFAGFSRAFSDLIRFLKTRTLVGTTEVYLDDCRSLGCLDTSTIDLVVTSPPYLNAIDYIRGHKLSLIWLGYTISELRGIRSTIIGAERALDGPAEAEAASIITQIEGHVSEPTLLPLTVLTRYAHDLLLFARQMERVLKPGACLIVVVGNSTIKGNFIRNDAIVEQALEHYGFNKVRSKERPIPENKRYLPLTSSNASSSITRRMRTETILHMTAPP